jgi:hypothetical protein
MLGKALGMQYKSNVRSIEHQFDTSRGATMSTATILSATTASSGFVRPEVRRPVRRPAISGPVARPDHVVPAPSLRSDRRPSVQSCRVEAAAPAGPWRLTDRGIALVLVLAVMITVAAVTVIGLTAWRVTSADYTTGSGASVSSR